MCDIQYKGQLSKEQVRERVGKYPLEDPATQEDLQHLADALDRNGTCPLARAINALTDKASDGKLYKPGRNDLMRLYDELALHKHLRLKVDDTTKLIYFICPLKDASNLSRPPSTSTVTTLTSTVSALRCERTLAPTLCHTRKTRPLRSSSPTPTRTWNSLTTS